MLRRPDPAAPAGVVIRVTDDPVEPAALDKPPQELIRRVTDVFPDICLAYVGKLAREQFCMAELVIQTIAGALEDGVSYPRKSIIGKRKRQRDPISEIISKPDEEFDESDVTRLSEYFEGPAWKAHVAKSEGYRDICVQFLMSQVYASTSRNEATKVFNQLCAFSLLKVYRALIVRHGHTEKPDSLENSNRDWLAIQHHDSTAKSTSEKNFANLHKEIHAARRIAAFEIRKILEDKKDVENSEMAMANGSMRDCGCCFSEEPMNRMVSCNVDSSHLFCYPCARKNAEVQIGLSKYQLRCMSMDDCPGHFYSSDRKLYLDKKVASALDRLEQDAVLQAANIENLTSCPFCPYAAECPPVEEDKELRCENPDCGVVSCRMCSKETHVPKTCEEAASDNKVSARHLIEEAMSAAMIRRCNKCATPFVKLSGCNKMTCTKPGCRNTQCYICGKSCDYEHFKRPGQGGGGCTLEHDANVDERHRREAEVAQETARKRVMEENPEIDEAELRIELPENPGAANNRTKARTRARPRPPALGPLGGPPAIMAHHAVQLPHAVPVPYGVQNPGQAGAQQQGRQFQFDRGQPFQFGHAQQREQRFSLAQAGLPPNGDAALWGATRQPAQRRPAAPNQIALPNYHAQDAVSPAPYLEHYYAANGGVIPGDRTAQVVALRNEAMRNWTQPPTEASAHIRQALEVALRPYIANMTHQVYEHIRGVRAVPVLQGVAADPLLNRVEKELNKGAASLAGREMEDIDMKFQAVPRGQVRGVTQSGNWPHGRIPAPETAEEYIAVHQMVRSQDVRTPPHHEELAHQAHARVLAMLQKKQQPPRIALYHCYGNLRDPGKRQPSLAVRMRMYLGMRLNRLGVQAQPDAQRNSVPNNMPRVFDLVTRGNAEVMGIPVTQAGPPSDAPTPPPGVAGSNNGLGLSTSLPHQRPGEVNDRAKKPTSNGRVGGSKEAPILIDDEDADGSETGCTGPNPLSFNELLKHAARHRDKAQGGGDDAEPPGKRCRI